MADFYYNELGRNNDIISVVLSGKLDAEQCEYVLHCVQKQIAEGYTKLILDCDKLDHITSVGLGMLVRAHSRMLKHGGDVKLAAVHGLVADTLHMVKLDTLLSIYPTVEDAVAAHGG